MARTGQSRVIRADDPEYRENLSRKVNEIGLRRPIVRDLERQGMLFVGDMAQKSRGVVGAAVGWMDRDMRAISKILDGMGLETGMTIEGWPELRASLVAPPPPIEKPAPPPASSLNLVLLEESRPSTQFEIELSIELEHLFELAGEEFSARSVPYSVRREMVIAFERAREMTGDREYPIPPFAPVTERETDRRLRQEFVLLCHKIGERFTGEFFPEKTQVAMTATLRMARGADNIGNAHPAP